LLKKNNRLKNRERTAKMAFKAFKRAARSAGWYRSFLKSKGCIANEIRSTNDFEKKVPLLSKETVFAQNSFADLVRCNTRKIQTVTLSSGHSGLFSKGIITRSEHRKLAVQTDLFLEIFFQIKKGEVLIINASAMGVRVFTKHTCCDTGPRADIVVALLKEVSPQYPKTVITADPHLIKQIVEDSIKAGFDWNSHDVWFISGGDWFPETLRGYVHGLIGKSASLPEKGFWAAIYGLTELGYPLFFETAQMAALRSGMASNRALFDHRFQYLQGKCTTPFLFNHLQSAFYVEQVDDENGVPELVFTTLDHKRAIPLVRYNTHDVGELLDATAFGNLEFPLPMVAFWGRNQKDIQLSSDDVTITDIKELLFSDRELAAKITGFFTLQRGDDNAFLSIQLKKGAILSLEIEERFAERLIQVYPSGLKFSFGFYHNFIQQMELDFERKFNHLIDEYDG
jgi:phenylacetate-coenzyme A ligase PaaK-like adenylate-forming protein